MSVSAPCEPVAPSTNTGYTVSSVELFKLSSETQLESDKHMIEWIMTGDETAQIRSDYLLQQSFEYEMAALSKFKLVQGQTNP